MCSTYQPITEYLDLDDVQRLLWGKSHFFDTKTMRVFGTRLLRAHRAGQVLLVQHRDKMPYNELVYSVTRFDLDTGHDKRVLKMSPDAREARSVFKAEWTRIVTEKRSVDRAAS